MNNIRNRKYARCIKKQDKLPESGDNPEFTLSSTAALGILAGTFLIGLASGKMLSLCKRLSQG